jgi:hypothetical protein
MKTLLTILALIAVWFTYINWRISENFDASIHETERIIKAAQAGLVHEMEVRAILEREAAHRVAEQTQQQVLNREWSNKTKAPPMNNWPC